MAPDDNAGPVPGEAEAANQVTDTQGTVTDPPIETVPSGVAGEGGGGAQPAEGATGEPPVNVETPLTMDNGTTPPAGVGETMVTVVTSPIATGEALKLGPDVDDPDEPEDKKHRGFRVSLLNSALLDLSIGTAVTVAVYIIAAWDGTNSKFIPTASNSYLAVAAGIIAAIAAGVASALLVRDHTSPNSLNPGQYAELQDRWTRLTARVQGLCPAGREVTSDQQIACTEVRIHRRYMARELGLRPDGRPGQKSTGSKWVLGTGFIDLWHRLHAAEQATFLVQSPDQLVANGLYDELRLRNSGIKNEGDLLKRLRGIVSLLGGKKLLVDATDVPDFEPAEKEIRTPGAPLLLADIRQAINEFRDDSREGLMRARNHLIYTGMVTGLVAYALLILAVLMQTPVKVIVGGLAFFLIGAVVGLFAQLRNSSSEDAQAGEEDFGLRRARLVYTPVLSGLAALGGVLVMATLYATLDKPLQVGDGNKLATIDIPALHDMFNVEINKFGLLVAAVFGLVPGLLVSSLQSEADRYKADLQNSSAQTGST